MAAGYQWWSYYHIGLTLIRSGGKAYHILELEEVKMFYYLFNAYVLINFLYNSFTFLFDQRF